MPCLTALADQGLLSFRAVRLDQLRQDVRRGLESGPGEPWDPEAIKQQGRARRAAAKVRARRSRWSFSSDPKRQRTLPRSGSTSQRTTLRQRIDGSISWISNSDCWRRSRSWAERETSCRLVFAASPSGLCDLHEPLDDGVEVLRLLHSARDVDPIFGSKPKP